MANWFTKLIGSVSGNVAEVNASNEVLVNSTQNIVLSTGNSSTANLASAATFTGTAVSNLGVGAIQVMFFADQNATIDIQQSQDNVNWDHVFTYTTEVSTHDVRTIFAAGSYVRVRATNNGGSTTTILRLQTVLVPMSVPSARLNSISTDFVQNPTYHASTIIPLVAATTVNVPFANIIGSATKIVTVKRIRVSGMSLTAVGYFAVNIEKLSTASSGGTSTTLVATPLDSRISAATAVVKAYTVAPTRGTLIGTVSSWRALWQATVAVAAGITNWYTFEFGVIPGTQGIVLRAVTEEVAMTFPVALGSAGTLAITFEWTEE